MLKTEAFYLEFLIAVLEDSREECERGNTPSKPGNVPKREGVLLVCSAHERGAGDPAREAGD